MFKIGDKVNVRVYFEQYPTDIDILEDKGIQLTDVFGTIIEINSGYYVVELEPTAYSSEAVDDNFVLLLEHEMEAVE
ncbi:MAG: hypothetical protein P4L79_10775 [Legionella sp.]|uniref:hypothetical protein n=1 Tax=Legionella sp. TaxID=459 RepID=UPI00284082AD|nr:hypothetical protein [Legionella sp.]